MSRFGGVPVDLKTTFIITLSFNVLICRNFLFVFLVFFLRFKSGLLILMKIASAYTVPAPRATNWLTCWYSELRSDEQLSTAGLK